MTRIHPRRLVLALACVLGCVVAGCGSGDQDTGIPAAPPPAAAPSETADVPPERDGPNVVQQEMQLLLQALQGTVAAIADDDLARVPALIHGVHDARAATEAAIEEGRYTPPKNPGQLETFEAMDAAFHQELVRLVEVAEQGELAATTTRFTEVLRHCQGCHAMFREMPAASAVSADPH